jgi:hypothetical protein
MRTIPCVDEADDDWDPPENRLALEVCRLAHSANPKWRQRAERLTFEYFFCQEVMTGRQYDLTLTRLKGARKRLFRQARNRAQRRLASLLGTDNAKHRPRLSSWHEQHGQEPTRHQGILVTVKRWY